MGIKWLPIKDAPKDGTPVLLKGGDDPENLILPCVVAFWDTGWNDEHYWSYAHWDGGWRSFYEKPTHFAYINKSGFLERIKSKLTGNYDG